MTELKPLMVVAIPARPPIDKLVAFKRIQLDNRYKRRLQVVFCDMNEPTADQLQAWQKMCSEGQTPYLLDVGAKKYHKLGSSAAEVEKQFSETESGKIFNQLVALIKKNNRNGFLKNQRHSVAKIIRQAYSVMKSGDSSQEVVFEHGMGVVNAFFSLQGQRKWIDLFQDPQYLKLKELWDGFGVREEEVLPFTLPLYFRQLFLSGREEEEIIATIGWWIDKVERVKRAKQIAENRSYCPRPFRICQKVAGLIHVNGCFEAEAAQYQWIGSGKLCVGIIRNELGQVHIKVSKEHQDVDLGFLFDELNRREPGIWYKEERFRVAMIMNGSNQFTGVPPSSFSDDELIRLSCLLIKCKKAA